MLKASENFKLLKTVLIRKKTPFFLIEHQGQEYISSFSFFVKNTPRNRHQLIKNEDKLLELEEGFKRLLDSPPASDWEVLTYGYGCFWGCPFEIGHWNIDLPNLVNGDSMFWGCKTLTRFSGNLDSLERGDGMFEHSGLAVFESDLPSLEKGWHMFSYSPLKSFDFFTPSIHQGSSMFYNTSVERMIKL